MSPEGSPLDLNHLPEDFTRDGKHVYEDTSTSVGEQSGTKNNGKDENGKVYECRFCSLKFCKSQALGGHMNRHRQERETETLNKARQLVYSSDPNLAAHPLPNLGSYVPPRATVYHLPPHQAYSTRPLMYSGAGSTAMMAHNHHQSCVYTSSTPPRSAGDYYMVHSHALTGSSSHIYSDSDTNYTCIGAPVGVHGLGLGTARRDHHQHEHHLDSPY